MNKLSIACIGVSLFIHGTLIGFTSGSGWLKQWLGPLPVPQQDKSLALEFIEVPDNVPETEVAEDTKVISDKTAAAQDEVEAEEEEKQARAREAEEGKQIAKKSMPQVPEPSPVPKPEPKLEEELEEIREDDFPPVQQVEKEPVIEQPQMKTIEYDIVNLPQVSESIFSTPSSGQLSFQTKEHEIGYYFKEVKKRIEKYWLHYLVFRYQNMAPDISEAVISFDILPSGEVARVKVLEYSGDLLFKDFCLASITNTAPFPPLPDTLDKELKEEEGLNIVFTFRYR